MNKLEKLVSNYMKTCETMKKLDKKTLKAYRIDLAQFQAFMLGRPDFEDKAAISDYISSLHNQYKPRTTKRKIATLKAFFHHLIYEEIIAANPFDKINVKYCRARYQKPRLLTFSPQCTGKRLSQTQYINIMRFFATSLLLSCSFLQVFGYLSYVH